MLGTYIGKRKVFKLPPDFVTFHSVLQEDDEGRVTGVKFKVLNGKRQLSSVDQIVMTPDRPENLKPVDAVRTE